MVATIGACIITLGGILFLVNVFRSRTSGAIAGDDPWDASTLEWAAASPPANYNFVRLPVVASPQPLWDPKPDRVEVIGLRDDRREALVTGLMDAEPQFRYVLPGPTIWPFVSAFGFSIGLAMSVFYFWGYFVSLALGAIGLVGWFWPRRPLNIEP